MEQILEINLISAQSLKAPSQSKFTRRTQKMYALVWVDHSSAMKLRTSTDDSTAHNPTWNDKFLFRVSPDFINSPTSGINVEVYTVGHLKDSLTGTARCLISTCLGKFTSVYLHSPSGEFHGILNMAAAASDIGTDMDLFKGSSTVSFHELTRPESNENKDKDKKSLLGRLRLVKSSPSLSTMGSSPTTPTSKKAATLRAVKSESSLSTMALSNHQPKSSLASWSSLSSDESEKEFSACMLETSRVI